MSFYQKKSRAQSTLNERMKRAEELLQRIGMLKKPFALENLSTMTDSQRILQALVNTQNIEMHE